jgi:hypothetical protein
MRRWVVFIFLNFFFNWVSAEDDLKTQFVGIISMYAHHPELYHSPIQVSVQSTPPPSIVRPNAVQLQVAHQHYQQYKTAYGVCPNSYQNIMNLSRDDFVQKVIHSKNLRVSEKSNLWHDYKSRCYRQNSQKFKDFCAHVEKVLQAAVHNEQQKIQDLQQPNFTPPTQQSRHEKLTGIYDQPRLAQINEQSWFKIERDQALQQTINEQFQTHQATYNFDAQTQAFLQLNHISLSDFINLCGTALQHQVYHEIVQNYEHMAQISAMQHTPNSAIMASALEFNEISFDANQHEHIDVSMMLSDLTYALTKQSKAVGNVAGVIGQGIKEYAYSWMYALQDPGTLGKQSVLQAYECANLLVCTIRFIFDHYRMPADYNDAFACVKPSKWHHDLDTFAAYCQALAQICNSAHTQFDQDPSVYVVKEVLTFTIDPLIVSKVLSASFKLLTSAQKAMHTRITSNRAQHTAAQLSFMDRTIKPWGKIATSIGDIEESLFHCMEVEKNFTSIASKTPNKPAWNDIAARLAKYGSKIPATEAKLIAIAQHRLAEKLATIRTWVPSSTYKRFCNIPKTLQGQSIIIKEIDFDHIVNYWYKFRQNGKNVITELCDLVFEGGHLASSAYKLEKLGLVKIREEILLSNGCKKFTLENLITRKIFTKTEFPASWDMEKLASKILESFDNIHKITRINEQSIRVTLLGKTREGIQINIVVEIKDNLCKIITAFP